MPLADATLNPFLGQWGVDVEFMNIAETGLTGTEQVKGFESCPPVVFHYLLPLSGSSDSRKANGVLLLCHIQGSYKPRHGVLY